jgi:hypothetical protein
MKINLKKWRLFYLLLAFVPIASGTFGQTFTKSTYSFNAAYSVLNAGTAASSSSTYVGNLGSGTKAVESVPTLGYRGPLDKMWNISLGIPTQVFLDHYYLQGRMVSAYEENRDLYWNGTPEFKNAVDFLYQTDFAPISSWAPVRCTVTFRFIPPVVGDDYHIKYDYQNNPSAAPAKGDINFWIR